MTGVRLDDGTELAADLVVAANGRRSAVADWLAEIGARPVSETVEDTGIVYASRFYRLLAGADAPPRTGPIGGDLGYVKYGTFVGDNRTFSITLAVPTGDDELRRRLADPVAFDAAARSLPATAPWLDGRAEPITPEVHMMAGLLNKWSDYVVDGEPAAVGLVPVGDAVLCTNPLYGRGCSTAYWSAQLLAKAIAEHPDDVRAVAVAYDEALRTEIHPWYRSSVEQDREARRVAAALLAGEDPYGDASDPRAFTRSVLRDGLAPALRSDQVVLRAFVRNLNLLSPPDAPADRRRLRRPSVRRAADQGRTPTRAVARSSDEGRLPRRPPRRLTRAGPPRPGLREQAWFPETWARGTLIRWGGCRG